MGILTVAVVSTPFKFEGNRRMDVALKGIEMKAANTIEELYEIVKAKQ